MKTTLSFLALLFFSSTMIAQNNDELIAASFKGDFALIKKNVEGGADVNYKNAQGQTAISLTYLYPEITEYLISKKADVNSGDTPALVSASRFYSLDVMKLLLKAGADPNKPAVVKVDLAAPIRKLLEEEKAKGKKGNKYMVKAYEDQLKTMGSGNIYTTYALQNVLSYTNCLECARVLVVAGAKDYKNQLTGGNALHEVATSYIPVSQRVASMQATVPALEQYGMGFPDWYKNLNIGDMGSANDIVMLLKNEKMDMEALDNNNRTPLMNAIMAPTIQEDVVMALVNNGANLKATGMNNDQTEFARETSDPSKIKVRFDFPGEGRNSNNGGGYSANMDLVNPKPKRVALISYYLFDAGKGKANITGVGTWRTPDGAGQNQVNGFYSKSIGKFKEAFAENGITLLTPNEFLDTQEKAEAYYGFVQESALKEKTSLTRSKTRSSSSTAGGWTTTTYTTTTATVGTLKVAPYDEGYRNFFVANEAEDESIISNFQGGVFTANRKLTSSLGNELCKELGVDAVMVVYIATRKPKQIKEDYGVNAVVAIMLGPNPVRSEGSDPDAKNLGQFYCGTRTFYGSPQIFKDDKGIFGQYDGMANVLRAHAIKMSNYINGKDKNEE
jgi:ankyrin repeat protein